MAARGKYPSDLLVIGGGVIGMACACVAAQAGAQVTVIEAAPMLGAGASGAKAGLLTAVAEGRSESPYSRFSKNGLAQLLAKVPILEAQTGLSAELEQNAHLRLSTSADETAILQDYLKLKDLRQETEQLRSPQDLTASRHWLSRRIACGVTGGQARHLNPSSYLAVLVARFRALGGQIDTGTRIASLIEKSGRIEGVQTSDGRRFLAAYTVLAAGVSSLDLLSPTSAGPIQAVQPVRGQMVVLDGTDKDDLPTEVISTARGYIVPKADGRIVVGATHEAGARAANLTLSGLAMLMKIASVAPALTALRVKETFVGLRPMSQDGLPLIGPVPGLRGLCLATGHGSHGILLSMITAETVMDHLTGQRIPTDMAAFLPERGQSSAPGSASALMSKRPMEVTQ